MTDKFILWEQIIKQPIAQEVQYLDNNHYQMPTLSEITNSQGQIVLSEEYKAKLRNPNANFNQEIIVFCKNTSCGCFCSKDECDCKNPEFSIHESGSQKWGNGTASGGVKLGGNAVSGDASFTIFRDSRDNGDLKVGTVSAGAYLVNGGFGGAVRASADVVSFKTNGFEARAGLNLDTGASISDNGLELKLAGFGVSVGEKLEVSTIAGSVSCVIQ